MKKILKIFLDFQNPPECPRERCTCLQAHNKEESLFYTTGKLTRAEKHEAIPQIALFYIIYLLQRSIFVVFDNLVRKRLHVSFAVPEQVRWADI